MLGTANGSNHAARVSTREAWSDMVNECDQNVLLENTEQEWVCR